MAMYLIKIHWTLQFMFITPVIFIDKAGCIEIYYFRVTLHVFIWRKYIWSLRIIFTYEKCKQEKFYNRN